MLITKRILEQRLSGFRFPAQSKKWYQDLNPDDCLQVEIFSESQYKTLKQNNLFHSLLDIFWRSGVCSFVSYFQAKLHYKKIAGLVKVLDKKELTEHQIEVLKDKILIIDSWGVATKDNAAKAITELKNDMDAAGVIGTDQAKKYEEVLKGIGDWYE